MADNVSRECVKMAGKAQMSSSSSADEKLEKHGQESFKSSIKNVLKEYHPDIGISSEAMTIMNAFVNDMFDRIATESSRIAKENKKTTISCSEIQTAILEVLPRDLAVHAMREGLMAMRRYKDTT